MSCYLQLEQEHFLRFVNRNSLEFDAMPLPALHAANVDRMRQRFEEAKQRMNLMHQRALDSGLIARGEGGGAGGSNPGFTNLRSSFEDSRDQVEWMRLGPKMEEMKTPEDDGDSVVTVLTLDWNSGNFLICICMYIHVCKL